jgi:hypothetical protein
VRRTPTTRLATQYHCGRICPDPQVCSSRPNLFTSMSIRALVSVPEASVHQLDPMGRTLMDVKHLTCSFRLHELRDCCTEYVLHGG